MPRFNSSCARITFSGDVVQHTGTSGIDLADQTQDSTVNASSITDTSGIGVAIGEVDDYYQTEPALMTSGNTVSSGIVQFPGQEYQDAVGVWTAPGGSQVAWFHDPDGNTLSLTQELPRTRS